MINWLSKPEPDASEDVKTRRVLLLFAVSLIVVGVGGLVAVLFGGDDDGSGGPAMTSPTTTEVNGVPLVIEMGPAADDDIAKYSTARAKELKGAGGERVAVVSLKRYVTEQEARALATGTGVIQLLAALPGSGPSQVEKSLSEWLDEQFAATREERDQTELLLPTVQDEAFRIDYEARIDELTAVLDTAYANPALVFALVVKAPAATLRSLAAKPDVRLVDVGPKAAAAPDAAFRGLRPEEATFANQPPTRPLPS